jgi:hypothetical protein
MSVGAYGLIRPADVSPADVDIIFHYVADRISSSEVTLKKLTSTDVLTPVFHNGVTGGEEDVEILGGMYNLKLDSTDFDKLGIYTLYLRGKEIRTTITDCGVLSSLPSVRGLVIDLSNVSSDDRNKFTPQGLVGYRVEYLDSETGEKTPNVYRVVTSSFYCEPITTNLSNTTQKAVRYRYSDVATNLIFLTVTPSSAPSSRPNVVPFIGEPNQNIILTNTFFNPTTIEIELVEHDFDTLSYALYSNQSKAIESGIYTVYDSSNNIYKQWNLYEIKDEFNETLYEIREKRDDIDESLNFDIITE